MASQEPNPAAVQTRLWDEIEKHQIGMLGLTGGAPQPFQPMTAFLERAVNQIWFFSFKDTDLAEGVGDGAPVMFVFQRDKDIYASIGGRAQLRLDRQRMDRYWNSTVAAWYPGGKDDPRLTMICMDCADAEVWLQEAGPARFAWEIVKANATDRHPDLGVRAHLNFH